MPVEVIKEVEKIVNVEVPVEVIKEVEKIVNVEVPVEVIKEIEVVNEVEKVVEKIVEVEVPVEVIKEIEVVNEVGSTAAQTYESQITTLKDEINIAHKKIENMTNELNEFKSKSKNRGIKIPKRAQKRDNLKRIEGIGPKIEQLLFDGNIYTWEELSKTDVSVIQEILDKAGPRYRMHKPNTWPQQAKLAADGKWTELDALQDQLNGGK